MVEQIALALGGRGDERLAANLAVPVGGPTLLRLIYCLDLPRIPQVVDRWHLLHARREALIDRVEVGDVHRRPAAAGAVKPGQPDPEGAGKSGKTHDR
jgi:hypothetical protein